MTIAAIADLCRVSVSKVRYHLIKNGIPFRNTAECLRGKPKSPSHRQKLSESKKGEKNPNFGKPRKHGYRCWYVMPDGKVVSMRSNWEIWFAEYLKGKNINFVYESESFPLSNGSVYTPDFYIPSSGQYFEVKGWFTEAHRTKIDMFRIEFPNKNLVIADKNYLESLGINLKKKWVLSQPTSTCNWCANQYHKSYPAQQFCSVVCRNNGVANGVCKKEGKAKTKTKRRYAGVQKGEHNNGAKLTLDDINKISELRKVGYKLREISELTGASIGNIGNVLKGRSWKQ